VSQSEFYPYLTAHRPRGHRLNLYASIFGAVSAALFFAAAAHAEEKEPLAVFEIGGAINWATPTAAANGGPTIAFEFTPIKAWLEIEIGTGPFFGAGPADWSTDVLFKKPFDLSEKVELMVGAGPAFDTTFRGSMMIGTEFAFDLMFWPWPDRMFGWFIEPNYTYSFINGHQQSLGISAGLLIAIR
jgi:hypothetical protein